MLPVRWVQSHSFDLDDQVVVSELGDPDGSYASLALLLIDDRTN